jgi:DNA invertase Pin-like site-specific DNA recombinase
MKAAIYIRVSTSKKAAQADTYQQNPRVQLEPLKKVCSERGWDFTVYEERISGAGKNRPQFNSLMEAARRGEFAAVLVWKFDRFARSLKDLVVALEELNAVGVRLVSFTEAIDTATPSGKALFAMAGCFRRVRAVPDQGTYRRRARSRPELRNQVRETESYLSRQRWLLHYLLGKQESNG